MWIVKGKGLYFTSVTETRNSVGELKQQRWRWVLKRHLKVNSRCLKLYRAYSSSFNSSNSSNSKGLYQSSGKGKESCLAFTSSRKREMRNPLLFCRSCCRRRCRCFSSLVLTLTNLWLTVLLFYPSHPRLSISVPFAGI